MVAPTCDRSRNKVMSEHTENGNFGRHQAQLSISGCSETVQSAVCVIANETWWSKQFMCTEGSRNEKVTDAHK